MLVRLFAIFLTCISAALFVFSCEDETKSNHLALIGRWEIISGLRNQKPTETLSGTYFRFGDDGKMQTNLPIGPEEPMEYTVSRNEIRQKSTPPVKYLIQGITDSTLALSLELRGMQFEMRFRRANQPPAEAIPPASEQDTLSN